MNLIRDYFGLFIFAFVVFVGGLVVLPTLTEAPETSPREMLGLMLAFVVIAGGFSWYYFSAPTPSRDRSPPPSPDVEDGRRGPN
jgi:hypothetical protein